MLVPRLYIGGTRGARCPSGASHGQNASNKVRTEFQFEQVPFQTQSRARSRPRRMHRHVRGPGACFGSALLARSNTMTLRVLLAVVFALLGAVAAEAESSVNVHHRVRLPGDTSTPFTHKGTVLLTPTGLSYAPAAAFRSQLTAWSSNATTDARYEVALQTSPVEDGNPDDWPRASVKLVRHLFRLLQSSSSVIPSSAM